VGQLYVKAQLGLPAHNARRDAAGLLRVVKGELKNWADRADTAKPAVTADHSSAPSAAAGASASSAL